MLSFLTTYLLRHPFWPSTHYGKYCKNVLALCRKHFGGKKLWRKSGNSVFSSIKEGAIPHQSTTFSPSSRKSSEKSFTYFLMINPFSRQFLYDDNIFLYWAILVFWIYFEFMQKLKGSSLEISEVYSAYVYMFKKYFIKKKFRKSWNRSKSFLRLH